MATPAMDQNEYMLLRFFHEIPNTSAGLDAIVLFFIITVANAGITLKTRCYYMFWVAITGIWEFLGYDIRVAMVKDGAASLMTFVVQQFFLMVSPILLAMVDYITFSRLLDVSAGIIDKKGRQRSCFAKTISWFFVSSDIFCFILQASGGGMSAMPARASMAKILLLVGVILQIFFNAVFVVVTVYVHRSKKYGFRGDKLSAPVFICMYATIFLMNSRNVFRVIEFFQGYAGYLATHEMYMYIFDFAPIYACFLIFTCMHYGFYLGPSAPARCSMMTMPTQSITGGSHPQNFRAQEGTIIAASSTSCGL